MARAPSQEPEGLALHPELLTPGEGAELLEQVGPLRFDPIVMHAQAARRTARHYGLGYDYESRTPRPGEPIPDWLEPRSGYVLAGAARWSWQHSIPATKGLRYSITFRTLRRPRQPAGGARFP